ncbi:MAG TPA: acyl-CoA dehydrogenase family protein [Polyangiaceae bacterium]|jgi:alkylation response protein AidB-like acyl-CoA dehydrogenase|nr:acyl-CoA dehydrogenase family protein [Polyangiaceae bacterium]
MDFQLTDDQRMLIDTVNSFTKKDSHVERVRQIRENPVGWDRAVWAKMGELGWLGVPFPEDVGGIGGTFLDAGLLIEQLGTTLVPEPYVPSVIVAGLTVSNYGTEEQKQKLLPSMIEGKTSLALAYVEKQSRYDVSNVETRAEKNGGDYVLRGKKEWVINGQSADHLLVSARTSGGAADAGGVSLFIVEKNAPGLKISSVECMDSHKAGMVELEGVKVGKDALIGEEGAAAPILERAQDYGAAAACCEGSGINQSTLTMTRDYLCEREQFGVKIGTFQSLQHRLVDMFVQVELCKSTAIMAMLRADSTDEVERKRSVSAAKKQLATGGFFVTRQGIQLHGGIGVTDEHNIGLYFKRMHTLCALYGDEAHHVDRFSSLPSFTANVS